MSASSFVWRGLIWLKADCWLEPALRPSGWTILAGHGVCEKPSRWHQSDPRHITVDVFERQMEWMLARGYKFITLGEGLRRLAKGEPMERIVTLTFDDGFRDVVKLAYPVMQKLKLNGCLFVIAGMLDGDQLLWTDKIDVVCRWNVGREMELQWVDGPVRFRLDNDDAAGEVIKTIKKMFRRLPNNQREQYFKQVEDQFAKVDPDFVPDDFRLASLEEFRGLDRKIMEIGNHTMTHPQLTQLEDIPKLRSEVYESKSTLELSLQQPINHFCYPAGDFSEQVITEVKRAGHHSAVTVDYGVNASGVSPFELKRLWLPPTLPVFKYRASGLEKRFHQMKS